MLPTDTRERILDAAQSMAQIRGFNAFSYADIATTVGVRKASIHHHFPSKEDLELALVLRYRQEFAQRLEHIARTAPDAVVRLRQYGALYQATLAKGGICLCGMMASDVGALPEPLRKPLADFFTEQVDWLAHVLETGRKAGELAFQGPVKRKAHALLASLQGGLLIAHATQDPELLSSLLGDLLAGVALH